jgi:5,10-methylenetetrahydromethanopterin reductase
MPARLDWAPTVRRAEELGFAFAHQADSQMVYADPIVALAGLAPVTSSIRLGTGVSNPLTRTAPAMASALASLNQLAPGRVFLAIGSGYTSMAAMGRRSATVAELRDYVRVVRALTRGEQIPYEHMGATTIIQMLNGDTSLDPSFVNLHDPIPLWVAAHGPRMIQLAGEVGDGLVLGVVRPTPSYMGRLREHLQTGAERAGRSVDELPISIMMNMYVRDRNEPMGSEPMKRAVLGLEQSNIGVYAAGRKPQPGSLGRVADEEIPNGYRPLAIEERRLAREAGFRADVPWYLRAYDGHGWRVRPELLPHVTEEFLRSRALIGTSDEIIRQVRLWEDLGVSVVGPLAQGDVDLAAEQIERFGLGVVARY